jgi:hypothetical protein
LGIILSRKIKVYSKNNHNNNRTNEITLHRTSDELFVKKYEKYVRRLKTFAQMSRQAMTTRKNKKQIEKV